MHIRKKRNKKALAVFFLGLLAYETCFPAVAYALTSGPTSPEATSFEPVDTTDMVNLQTGDFTYNTPIIEVPGPEGGYPLSLSYHAGIQNDEEASWVGLGWTLNPGAITRSVNGYADDWANSQQQKRDFWAGTTSRSFGVDIGIGLGPANVSLGTTFTSHNGEGFSVDFKPSLSVSKSVGILPGVNIGSALSTDFKSVKFEGVRINGGGIGSLGISLASKEVTATASMRNNNGKSFYSSTAGKVNSTSGGWQTPTFNFGVLTFAIGSQYYRNWSDNTAIVGAYGSIYSSNGLSATNFNSTTFDSYYLPDNGANVFATPDVEYQVGAAMPDFDNYMVNAQGLNGAIRPYVYKANVAGLNRTLGISDVKNWQIVNGGSTPVAPVGRPITYKIPSSALGNANPKTKFRFIKDFSNTYRQAFTNFVDGSLAGVFDANPVYGDGLLSSYDPTENYLEGSKHIEYYTNAQIIDLTAKAKGFVNVSPDNSLGFTRLSNSMIGGFSITAANGVTYHFALPALNTGEMTYTEKVKATSTEPARWTKERKDGDYAYTWYLTSITGPDFVDRDGNGVANQGDFGYWVNMGYGKWNNSYNWRNPAEGFMRDVDNEFENFSHGQKELYYLNSITTRTHTAIFEKDLRVDGRGLAARWNAVYSDADPYLGTYSTGSAKTLRLNRILLLNNSDVSAYNIAAGTGLNTDYHYPNNVWDKYDLANTGIEQKCLKIIQFNQDNSLCSQTRNSFSDANVEAKLGKLTLNSINVLGKGGANLLPLTEFSYEDQDLSKFTGTLTFPTTTTAYSSVTTSATPDKALISGDLVNVKMNDGKIYTAYVAAVSQIATSQWGVTISFIGNVNPPSTYVNTAISISRTKNPNYNAEAYDKWGMYKCDYNTNEINLNKNAGRLTTTTSARHTDAWSMRKVSTQLGADLSINYESDTYSQSAIENKTSLVAENFVQDQANNAITFKVNNTTRIPLATLFPVNAKAELTLEHNARNTDTNRDLVIPFVTSTNYTGADSVYYNNIISYTDATTGALLSTFRTPYSKYTNGVFLIKSINEAAQTVTVSCFDPFYFGTPAPLFSPTTNIQLLSIVAGNIYFYRNGSRTYTNYGGGVRVKELSLQDGTQVGTTQYNYNVMDDNISSGVTSYEPNSMEGIKLASVIDNLNNSYEERYRSEFREHLNQSYGKILALSRLLPSPAVMYEYVTVHSQVKNIKSTGMDIYDAPGKTTYQFVVPDANNVSYQLLGSYQNTTMGTRNYSLVDNTAAIGSMRRKIDFDNLGNRLKETISTSSYDESGSATKYSRYNNQGEIMERYISAKLYRSDDGKVRDFAIMTGRTEEPNIMTGEQIIDYKNGTRQTTTYLGYDFYSGQLTRQIETDLYGNAFLTEIIPAYRKYPSMGLKIGASGNKNMLTQTAGTYVYKADAITNAKQSLISASIQTWSNAVPVASIGNTGGTSVQNGTGDYGNVWRKQSNYIWMAEGTNADGLTPIAEFADFNWTNPTSLNAAWKRNLEHTLYDVYSKELEVRDINNNYAASRLGYNDTKILTTGNFGAQNELAFSGAEDDLVNGRFSGFISKGDGTVVTSTTFPVATAHTGYNSLMVNAGKSGFSYDLSPVQSQKNKAHVASVWVKSVDGSVPVASIYSQVSGIPAVYANVVPARKSGDWYQLIIVSNFDISTTTFGCINNGTSAVYFDDFRIRPAMSESTAYVYDKFTGTVTYILDNNNMFTRYEYDAVGRLTATYKETFANGPVKVSENEYNYGKGH